MGAQKLTEDADGRPVAPDPTCGRMLAALAAGTWREGITTGELATLTGLSARDVERHRPHLIKSLSAPDPLACINAHHPMCESCDTELSDGLCSLFELWETAAESAASRQETDVYVRCMADLKAALGMVSKYEGM